MSLTVVLMNSLCSAITSAVFYGFYRINTNSCSDYVENNDLHSQGVCARQLI